MSDPKTQIPDLSKTSFMTWKQKILGHCQMLGWNKYLTTGIAVPANQLKAYKTNCSKTLGIILSFMGTINYTRFVIKDNKEDPVVLWKLLTDHSKAKTSGNHAKVYNNFIMFQFKGTNLAAYLKMVRKHLKIMLSVRMKFEGANLNVKESLISDNIVLKLPEKYTSSQEFLYSKRPLTIKLVKETFKNKHSDVSLTLVSFKTNETAMSATKNKSKRQEYCSGSKHNPKAIHPQVPHSMTNQLKMLFLMEEGNSIPLSSCLS
ncbi:hypothetical protein VP01_4628g3 [Puccinia sorghi]|uniref:Uncharacterized protein n=1 Tax=Puccinia sorghi TaxID=27349 RepID=A0A0L6UQD4_9BASI|nr:hypothetical protein VP01_4628g3 [Puccinia sorghi]